MLKTRLAKVTSFYLKIVNADSSFTMFDLEINNPELNPTAFEQSICF
jgi:hypothetical protein